MTPAAVLVVCARWLDVCARGELRRGWEADHWRAESNLVRDALRGLTTTLAPEPAAMLGELVRWLGDADEGEPLAAVECAAWRDRLHELAASPEILGHAAVAATRLHSLRRFWIACEYRLRIESGEHWKVARGAVADAWGGISDSTPSDYASREAGAAARFIAATLAGSTQERTAALASAIRDFGGAPRSGEAREHLDAGDARRR